MRVVLADGNRAIRYGVGVALRDEPDIEVVGEAEDGSAAIRLVHELHPDVVVLDLSLARIGGLDVIRELALLLPQTQFVVFSNETRLRSGALFAGAAAFVTKDSPDEQLLREMRRVASAPKRGTRALRLGEVLLERNLITSAHLEAALAWQRELKHAGRRAKLGELLKQIGALSEEDLESGLRPDVPS
jgi:DNA-binding NarL/FixJ family response regulator